MSVKMKKRWVLGVAGVLLWCRSMPLFSQDSPPTVIFFTAYLFEARSNGEELSFPLLPGDITVTTLSQMIETSQDYIENLRSIYAFKNFSFLAALGGGFTIGLKKTDGGISSSMIVGAEDQTFLFSASSRSGPDNGRLPLRLEAKLDTLSYVGGNDKVSGKIDLFQTLCSVTHGHPLVIGRPLPENRHGEKRAFFLVFTPFFREITGPGVYDLLLKDFRNVLKVSTSTFGLDVKNLFDSINRYFQKKFQMDDLKSITAQIPELGEARKESDKDEIFYTPYDRPPSPVGGYSVLQKRLVYPEIARKSGIEGKVLVYALVSAEGRIEQVKVMQSLIGCDEAAIDAVRSVRWQPAIGENGKPVKVWVMVPIEFRLK